MSASDTWKGRGYAYLVYDEKVRLGYAWPTLARNFIPTLMYSFVRVFFRSKKSTSVTHRDVDDINNIIRQFPAVVRRQIIPSTLDE